jgi:hypothetical protein
MGEIQNALGEQHFTEKKEDNDCRRSGMNRGQSDPIYRIVSGNPSTVTFLKNSWITASRWFRILPSEHRELWI